MLTSDVVKLAYMASSIGDRIKESRIEENRTQQEVADAAGVSRSAVSQWENGDTKELKPTHLFEIAAYLKRNPRWLATGQEPKHPQPVNSEVLKIIINQVTALERSGKLHITSEKERIDLIALFYHEITNEEAEAAVPAITRIIKR